MWQRRLRAVGHLAKTQKTTTCHSDSRWYDVDRTRNSGRNLAPVTPCAVTFDPSTRRPYKENPVGRTNHRRYRRAGSHGVVTTRLWRRPAFAPISTRERPGDDRG